MLSDLSSPTCRIKARKLKGIEIILYIVLIKWRKINIVTKMFAKYHQKKPQQIYFIVGFIR